MKTNLLFKQITILMCVLAMAVGAQAQTQCTYEIFSSESATGTTTIQIPSDFPVLNHDDASDAEKQRFESELAIWKKNNPGFENLSFRPLSSEAKIIIPINIFENYSSERKTILEASPYFYIIKK